MNVKDALVHLDSALDALTLEAWTAPVRDSHRGNAWEKVPAIQATLAIELERIDRALGPRGKSMFAPIAENIKQAVIEIVAAQNALKESDRG